MFHRLGGDGNGTSVIAGRAYGREGEGSVGIHEHVFGAIGGYGTDAVVDADRASVLSLPR